MTCVTPCSSKGLWPWCAYDSQSMIMLPFMAKRNDPIIRGGCVHAPSCLTLCDPMDCSPPGSSVLGVFQGRILEWIAVASSMGSSWPQELNSHLLRLLHWQWILPRPSGKSLSWVGLIKWVLPWKWGEATPDSPGLEESEKLCCGPPLERLGGEDLRAALSWLSARKCDLSPANARNRIQLKIWMSQTVFRVPDKIGALAHTMISALWEPEQRAQLHHPRASDPWKLYNSNYESKSW